MRELSFLTMIYHEVSTNYTIFHTSANIPTPHKLLTVQLPLFINQATLNNYDDGAKVLLVNQGAIQISKIL